MLWIAQRLILYDFIKLSFINICFWQLYLYFFVIPCMIFVAMGTGGRIMPPAFLKMQAVRNRGCFDPIFFSLGEHLWIRNLSVCLPARQSNSALSPSGHGMRDCARRKQCNSLHRWMKPVSAAFLCMHAAACKPDIWGTNGWIISARRSPNAKGAACPPGGMTKTAGPAASGAVSSTGWEQNISKNICAAHIRRRGRTPYPLPASRCRANFSIFTTKSIKIT